MGNPDGASEILSYKLMSNNIVRFNMANLSSSSNIIASSVSIFEMSVNVVNHNSSKIDPMLDDGAPYSAIRIEEMRSRHHLIMPELYGSLESNPESIAE